MIPAGGTGARTRSLGAGTQVRLRARRGRRPAVGRIPGSGVARPGGGARTGLGAGSGGNAQPSPRMPPGAAGRGRKLAEVFPAGGCGAIGSFIYIPLVGSFMVARSGRHPAAHDGDLLGYCRGGCDGPGRWQAEVSG
jgi:hypothetical protein